MPSKEKTKHQMLAGLKGRITCTNRSPKNNKRLTISDTVTQELH